MANELMILIVAAIDSTEASTYGRHLIIAFTKGVCRI